MQRGRSGQRPGPGVQCRARRETSEEQGGALEGSEPNLSSASAETEQDLTVHTHPFKKKGGGREKRAKEH